MRNYAYPAVFMIDKEDGTYHVLFPDLELTIDSDKVEEAYAYAKASLKAYFVCCEKYDLSYNEPSDFEDVKKSCKKDDLPMIIEVEVDDKDLK